MSRIKGSDKTGGRMAGTPNKVTCELKEWITSILEEGKEQFMNDMRSLSPIDRVRVYTSLLNYVLPKQQSMDVRAQVEAEYDSLTKLIEKAPDEFIDKITAKVIELQEANEDEE
jgi:hypothetical protein